MRPRVVRWLESRHESVGTTGDGAYTLTVREKYRTVSTTRLPDPFVNARLYVRGWRNALRVLFRRYEVTVKIDSDRERMERVLELNPDYLGPAGTPSRKAWELGLNEALHKLADGAA